MGTEFETAFAEGETGEAAARSAAERARAAVDADAVDLAVVFPSPAFDPGAVVAGVREVVGDADLVGGVAEGTFTERGVHTSFYSPREGVTVALVASDEMQFHTGLGRQVSADAEAAMAAATADVPESVEGYPHRTGMLLSSAVFSGEELAQLAYQRLPVEWAGGGASDTSLENNVVFVDDEVAADAVAVLVADSERPFALGVGNRHEPVGDPVEVTRADGQVVHELDGRPAYEVWRETFADLAREEYGIDIDAVGGDTEAAFRAFMEFVFGVRTGDDEYKVRSPAFSAFFEPYAGDDEAAEAAGPTLTAPTLGTLPEGALQFAHPIAEGMVLYPMASGARETIDRGTRSASQAAADLDGDVAGGLVFDCPCGEVTLREEYGRLVEAIADPVDAPLAGIQSGSDEICFRRDDMRGVHETATSVLLFPGGEEP